MQGKMGNALLMCKSCVYSFYYCWTGDGLTWASKISEEKEENEELIPDESRREKEKDKDEKTSDEKSETDECWRKVEEGDGEDATIPGMVAIDHFLVQHNIHLVTIRLLIKPNFKLQPIHLFICVEVIEKTFLYFQVPNLPS